MHRQRAAARRVGTARDRQVRELWIHRELAVTQRKQNLECALFVGSSRSVRNLAMHETNRTGTGGALKGEHTGRADFFEPTEQVLDAVSRDSSFENRLCNHDSWK